MGEEARVLVIRERLMRSLRYAVCGLFLLLVGALGQTIDEDQGRDEPERWTP